MPNGVLYWTHDVLRGPIATKTLGEFLYSKLVLCHHVPYILMTLYRSAAQTTMLTLELHTLTDTDRLGALLAEVLPPAMTVALNGTLGAGKTRLVEALAAALGVPRDDVVSPTFVLCQQYAAQHAQEPRMLYHFDAYRLRDEDEFIELGIEEYFESTGIVLVEWADRVNDCLPRDHLTIELEVQAGEGRTVKLSGSGRRSVEVLERLRERWKQDDSLP